jgi:hypothetical protein
MAELDVALRELGRQVEFPPTPDLATAVRGRLDVQVRAGWRSLFRRAPSADAENPRRWGRLVAVALAVLVVAVGAVLAVPPARTAILDWLGLRGVSIVRVDELPPTAPVGRLDLGRRATLEEAPAWALVPDEEPDSVWVEDGTVNLLWGTPDDVRLLLTEFRGEAFIEKLIEPDTEVEPVSVNGLPGAWLEQPHVVVFKDPRGRIRDNVGRLAGKTLLWQDGEVTLRLEGDLSKAEALRIARSAD